MSRYLSYIIAVVLVLSATCNSLTLSLDDQIHVLSELAEESEGGMESTDIRLFSHQLPRKTRYFKIIESDSIIFSENPASVNFQEVPNPPPKS